MAAGVLGGVVVVEDEGVIFGAGVEGCLVAGALEGRGGRGALLALWFFLFSSPSASASFSAHTSFGLRDVFRLGRLEAILLFYFMYEDVLVGL